ncbi:hypothetical protein [Verrucomicrobium sp. BvORR034]|uniref:hypothetical protein n=1 Tax=Verrucomicrobium sp. BvORR034 TaxID=1396418 RepID=UPI000679CECE|nr:hypothetical protein [Verrucomicrobium sp. BvORR034]
MDSVLIEKLPTRRQTWEESMGEQGRIGAAFPRDDGENFYQYAESDQRMMQGLPVLWPPCRDDEL